MLKKTSTKIISIKSNLLLVLILSLIANIITNIAQYFLNLNDLIYKDYSLKLSIEQIQKFLYYKEKIDLLNYIIVPIIIYLKTVIISSVIYVGTFFFNKIEITFKNIFRSVIKAEFIFLLVPILKSIWFYFFQTDYTLEDIQYFYPLSVINITGYNDLVPWLIYPFQALNLFELAYILFLGYELGKLTETDQDFGLKIMAYSYIPMMVLWIAVVMFFTLNYS